MMQSCSERKMMIRWRLCLIFSLFNSVFVCASPSRIRHLCRPDQKDALLEFKSEFFVQESTYGHKKSWRNNTDCCSWNGIFCDPKTGMVVELDLSVNILNGPLRSNSSLYRLQHVESLDLSWNNLSGTLPESISNLKHLIVLRLAGCFFFGNIPYSLGNLSYLTELHLYDNGFTGELPDSIGSLSQLTELKLDHNKLSGNFPHVILNMSELTWIDLRYNQFQGMLPSNMSSLSKLEDFDISGNSFRGPIPSSLFMIPSLTNLRLGSNDFSGPLEIGNISSPSKLQGLSLRDNNFNGKIPGSISKLVGLRFLDLSLWDTGRGMVDLSVFSHLMSLESLHLSGNHLKISETLSLPSPIEDLVLSSCNISEFPKFLQNQTSLWDLDISANRIEGQVPEWLWSLPELRFVNISQNYFSGFEGSADVIQTSEKIMLDISSNIFQDLPLLPKSLFYLLGSKNGFSGEIPLAICDLVNLDTLVLSNNNFNGSIPQCFENFGYTLSVLHLQNNSLSGVFPDELFNGRLTSLDVGHNRLSGKLPKFLINCTRLEFLNVEDNNFNDTFPFWLRLLPNLQIIVLRSNQFHGPISSPGDSLSFPKLRIFDISKNRFTGVLPSDYFAGLSALSSSYLESQTIFYEEYYQKSVGLTNKGLEMELVGSGFTVYKTIDVSGNRLEGDIPESIGLLKELIVLNMSNNAFTGSIPPSLGNLTSLESLDLSQNRISGKIPPELGKLTFLEQMNFSHNMLEGPIPQGTQIQSQNSYAFAENPELCGAPLQETCGRKEKEEATKQEEEEGEAFSWIAAAIAYVPGVFCGLTIGHILASYKPDWFLRIFHSFT